MTQKFKFGDRVRFLPTGQIGIIGQVGNENKKWVAYFEDGDTGYFSSGFLDQIEVIPHPDTVRLDWLLKQPNYTYPDNGYDDEGEPIEGVVLRQEYNMGDSARVIGHGKDARAAIDDAMQHEANHE